MNLPSFVHMLNCVIIKGVVSFILANGGPETPKPELIFVTNITNYICGEKIVMWRNFGEVFGNFGIFWEILGGFATIYALSCGEKLSPKVHLWRKNDKYEVWFENQRNIVFNIHLFGSAGQSDNGIGFVHYVIHSLYFKSI